VGERTAELVVLLLAVVLAAGAIALGGGGSGGAYSPGSGRLVHGGGATAARAHVALIERRVEALRGLRFRHPVPVAVVSPARTRRDGLADFDRSQPVARRRASEELLELLGLLPPRSDLRRIESAIYGEQIAGYYDPRRKRLALVRGAGVDDVTLAHELTHALEDQHVDLRRFEGGGDDRSTAQQALVEGTATLVMERYAARWPSARPLGDALAGLTQTTAGTPLPQYVMRTLVFPYFQGEAFVQALLRAGGGGWRLVDVAERARPPRTTAEILQPRRWLLAQQPVRVALGRGVPPASGGWQRLAGSALGQEDLATLLARDGEALSRGWRGGRYALWRRAPLAARGCASPCRARDALQLAVAMEDTTAARALGAGLGVWLGETLHGRRGDGGGASGGLWRLPGGSFGAVRWRGATVRAALAPRAAIARRLTG
jgi:hypothetical protein